MTNAITVVSQHAPSEDNPAATREPAPRSPSNPRQASPATQTLRCASWLSPPEEGSLVAAPNPACPIGVDGPSEKQPGRPVATSTSHLSRQRRQDRNRVPAPQSTMTNTVPRSIRYGSQGLRAWAIDSRQSAHPTRTRRPPKSLAPAGPTRPTGARHISCFFWVNPASHLTPVWPRRRRQSGASSLSPRDCDGHRSPPAIVAIAKAPRQRQCRHAGCGATGQNFLRRCHGGC